MLPNQKPDWVAELIVDTVATRTSIHLHVAARDGHQILTILEREGVDFSRVVLGHVDIAFGHLDTDIDAVLSYHRTLAARGAFIEYDTCAPRSTRLEAARSPHSGRLSISPAHEQSPSSSRKASATDSSSRTTSSPRANYSATAASATHRSCATSSTTSARSASATTNSTSYYATIHRGCSPHTAEATPTTRRPHIG
jgi:hypothetical protein